MEEEQEKQQQSGNGWTRIQDFFVLFLSNVVDGYYATELVFLGYLYRLFCTLEVIKVQDIRCLWFVH